MALSMGNRVLLLGVLTTVLSLPVTQGEAQVDRTQREFGSSERQSRPGVRRYGPESDNRRYGPQYDDRRHAPAVNNRREHGRDQPRRRPDIRDDDCDRSERRYPPSVYRNLDSRINAVPSGEVYVGGPRLDQQAPAQDESGRRLVSPAILFQAFLEPNDQPAKER